MGKDTKLYPSGGTGLHSLQIKNGKTRFTSQGKLMTEHQFYNQLDPGAKDNLKPRYRSEPSSKLD